MMIMGPGFFIHTLAFSLLYFRTSFSQQPNTDFSCVFYFFHHMGLPSSSQITFSSHVCSWRGVFCDSDLNHVYGLVLPNMALSGKIPENSIGKLSRLRFLDLSNNRIKSLPSDFWSLGSLVTLNLSRNRFSGDLPTNIGNFGSLETLDLSFNDFSGEIPATISSLENLKVLKLNHNAFESSIPSSILNCKSLVSMDLSSNRLDGRLPLNFLAGFPKLEMLSLAGNAIQGRDSDFLRLKSIKNLNISRNCFQGSVVKFFQEPLEIIDLSNNQFEGHISLVNFSSSFDWSTLNDLDLSENQVSGEILQNMHQFWNIKHINLANNKFYGQKFPQIGVLMGLEYLNLSRTSLRGAIPGNLSQLTNLKVVDLSQNNLSGNIPSLMICKNLKTFDASYNNLSGGIPLSVMDRLLSMERFNLSYNHFSLCGYEPQFQKNNSIKTAFIGSSSISCPIAVSFKRRSNKHKGFMLSIVLTLSMVGLMAALLFMAICCRRKTKLFALENRSHKEEKYIWGPFSFKTDSTTWVADIKNAATVPILIFEKPLLNFTFADLLSATSNFDRATLLADGRFGPVYRGFLPVHIDVAIKVLIHASVLTDEEAARELETLGRIKHPNLVPLVGYCLPGEQRIAIYDYMENGNLQNLLHDSPPETETIDEWENDEGNEIRVGSERHLTTTTWRFRHNIALGTARALAFLHHGCSPPMIHGDVRSSSVFLDSNFEPKLSDFGLAKIFGNDIPNDFLSMAPEFLQSSPGSNENSIVRSATTKSDVYGFGVILMELVTGMKAGSDLVNWVRGLMRGNEGVGGAIDPRIRGTGSEAQMKEALKIGYLCTADLPLKRPSMQQIVGLLKDVEP